MSKAVLNNCAVTEMFMGPSLDLTARASTLADQQNGWMAVVVISCTHLRSQLLLPCPPVVVEIQHTVNASYMRRLVNYCGHVFDEYYVEPIAITIEINTTSNEISNKVTAAPKVQYFTKLPSDYWAQHHYSYH
ncbi:predicted protein [Lichtheimia corymbifera JMRC:FSU:9682]|uniref:Uncharacterized protein n=1 Tax=Lichtheimia corymbifera JMRC:FSU:9682 TaxID=1263082 RepID=A0A068S4K9_9FUNG|nr:predicted protein [Lichtheimia corymbifera JMRC:FSU:9682]